MQMTTRNRQRLGRILLTLMITPTVALIAAGIITGALALFLIAAVVWLVVLAFVGAALLGANAGRGRT